MSRTLQPQNMLYMYLGYKEHSTLSKMKVSKEWLTILYNEFIIKGGVSYNK